MINLDFLGRLFRFSQDEVFFEMGPKEAFEYAKAIYQSTAATLAERHLQFFARVVIPKLKIGLNGFPFEVYRRETGSGDNFFITRLSSSHRNAIRQYILEMLRGPKCGLVLTDVRMSELLAACPQVVAEDEGKIRVDTDIDAVIALFAQDHIIVKFWNLYRSYELAIRMQSDATKLNAKQISDRYGTKVVP